MFSIEWKTFVISIAFVLKLVIATNQRHCSHIKQNGRYG